MTTAEERCRTLLADLGKPTMRGVKKCPKCGTYNGSRGSNCKNKSCDAVFKEPADKRRITAEACRLITGSTAQVFSVKVKDKGPEYRGFVQLPAANLNTIDEQSSTMTQGSALCFVDNCEKSFKSSVLQCHEKDGSKKSLACSHILAAARCYAEAQPLTLRHSVLSSLNVSNEIRQDIWSLATGTSGPLVQRLSKNMMAVKCKISPKHPLGYLHFSIYTIKLKDKVEYKYFCNCCLSKTPCGVNEDRSDSNSPKRCVHFYACICAFASDRKLSEEFQNYINLDLLEPSYSDAFDSFDFEFHNPSEVDDLVEMDLDSFADDTHLLIFRDDSLTIQNLQCDRLDMDSIHLDPALLNGNFIDNMKDQNHDVLDDNIISEVHNLEVIDQNAVFDGSTIKIIRDPIMVDPNFDSGIDSHSLLDSTFKPLNGLNGLNGTVKIVDPNLVFNTNNIGPFESDGIPIEHNNRSILKKPVEPNNRSILKTSVEHKSSTSSKRKLEENRNTSVSSAVNRTEPRKSKKSSHTAKKSSQICDNIDESNTNLSFIKWLSSITERINQTMHFQFNGKPDALIFHVPLKFFECLRERISFGGKKKRLPNSTTVFVRRDGPPLGTFTKYTWNITNILHVKSIFDTPLMPLEITRSFIQNVDGSYELYHREETEMDKYRKTEKTALIKPLELKTFLKVGNTSPDQVNPTPFLIEWIPDILPISKIGELRIKFEFGHVRNESSQKIKKLSKYH